MRENRTYGSEGGEGNSFPTPISWSRSRRRRSSPLVLRDKWRAKTPALQESLPEAGARRLNGR